MRNNIDYKHRRRRNCDAINAKMYNSHAKDKNQHAPAFDITR